MLLNFAIVLLLDGCYHSALPPARLVAFGDSITRGYAVPEGAGWVEIMAARLHAKRSRKDIAVVNSGGNANTSSEGLYRIESDVLAHLPGLVLVEFGGNDAVNDPLRNISPDKFEQNILKIYNLVTKRGGTIVLVTFPPIINNWHGSYSDPYYDKWGGLDNCVDLYRERTRQLAKHLGCRLFDLDHFLRDLIKKNGAEDYIQRDGVHLTPIANRLVAEAMITFLSTFEESYMLK
ncbi:MAG: hypothetical protein KA257_05935 [Opitutaceae bacterium]|nr:hypothetical protein [Opitutaceae bacterium]